MKVCPETGLYLDPATGRGIDAVTSQVIGKKKWRKTLDQARKKKKKQVTFSLQSEDQNLLKKFQIFFKPLFFVFFVLFCQFFIFTKLHKG